MSYTANIINQSDYMVTKLVAFMECEDCPSDAEGCELVKNLTARISNTPELLSHIQAGVLHLYADKVNQICEQYELN